MLRYTGLNSCMLRYTGLNSCMLRYNGLLLGPDPPIKQGPTHNREPSPPYGTDDVVLNGFAEFAHTVSDGQREVLAST